MDGRVVSLRTGKMTSLRTLAALLAIAVTCLLVWLFLREPHSAKDLIQVPEGFELQLAATPPLVERPIVGAFDEQGFLYVAESSGSNDKVEKQLQEKPHSILRLEDSDDDGTFDKRIVFADRMMFPEGTMWFDGSLYVAAPPSIWKLTDTDGDGVADRREEWFQGKTLTGCANDLHGPYLGLDGWIYWCKGAFAEQTHPRPVKAPLVTRAAHVFRRRPGDTFVESVMTGGMDNPVDVVFTPGGQRIVSATFVRQPGEGRRDGLIHAVYGGVYGKAHGVTDGHQKTGELLPPMTHFGPGAPCGLARYHSTVFGQEYQNNLFTSLFNLHKVTRHVLVPKGATFETRDSDFLVSSAQDFHPTDVLEDADGSLLVIDTGGWYKLCCPTSQLAKPDVPGAIYRIRKRGAPRIEDPRGRRIDWDGLKSEKLADLLDDERPAVRSQAIHRLSKLGPEAFSTLSETVMTSHSVRARRGAVWALTRIEDARAREMVRPALSDQDESIRQAALNSVSAWRDTGALPQLMDLLKNGSSHLRRTAAEALGRIGQKTAVPGLLAQAGSENDRILEHALTYALIQIDDPIGTVEGLQAPASTTRKAALIALDQMDSGNLAAATVTALLSSDNPPLKDAAWWIIEHHPDWGEDLTGFFQGHLADETLSLQERKDLEERLASLATSTAIQELLASLLQGGGATDSRLAALRSMAHAPLRELPAAWTTALARVLSENHTELLRGAVSAAAALPIPEKGADNLKSALLGIGRDVARKKSVRLQALAAVPEGPGSLEPELFEVLTESIDPSQPLPLRTAGSSVLGKAQLVRKQLLALTDSLPRAGPLELPKLLSAFSNSGDEKVGQKLLASLRESRSLASLRPDQLRSSLLNFPKPVREQAQEFLTSLDLNIPQQKALLEELLESCKGGDARRGQSLFNGSKAACSSCHEVGYLGGDLGPDLSRIGQIRSERDLLESLVFPSASFVRSYEPVVIETRSGEVHNGILREDAHDEVLLVTGAETRVRLARTEIAEIRPGTVSVMPSGLDQLLSEQELADLLAFLKETALRRR